MTAWTPEMQALWDRAMLLARTARAYGCAFPMPGTSFPPPAPGSMPLDIIIAACLSPEEFESLLETVRKEMTEWKARVRSAKPSQRPLITDINLAALEINI